MTEIPTIYVIRKKKDRKLTIVLSAIAWVFCFVLDWIIGRLFPGKSMFSWALAVVVLSLLNAFFGFWVWRRLDSKEKWVVYRAIIASVLAIFIVPTRSGPLTWVYGSCMFFGIALAVYFGMPIQRLVTVIERQRLTRKES
jgi:low temperature requirement protein LtrA